VIGIVFFLFPMALLIGWLSWPLFMDSFVRHEVSTNAGGLIIWPARLMVPIGFTLLFIQGVSRAHQAHRVPARGDPRSARETPREVGRGGARAGDRAPAQ
jgi:TRAP-type mannitol/chloroaromatic compound transport system permease small subunit